jgi:hypothetical protein
MTKNANKGPAASEAPAPESTQAAVAMVKARVLVAGVYGNVDDLVDVPEAEAAASGDLDTHPDAVAYLERELKKEARRMAFREGHPEDPAA